MQTPSIASEQMLMASGLIWVQLMTETKEKSQHLDQTIFGLQTPVQSCSQSFACLQTIHKPWCRAKGLAALPEPLSTTLCVSSCLSSLMEQQWELPVALLHFHPRQIHSCSGRRLLYPELLVWPCQALTWNIGAWCSNLQGVLEGEQDCEH